MSLLAALASLFGTVLTPAALFLCSAGIVSRTGIGKILDMKPLFLREKGRKNRQSPLSALSLALAGTLGVGNITGVASALTAGGPGAVFWMWAGAAAVIPVKYAEVRLAVRYRIRSGEGWTGGAMYTIRDGLGGAAETDRGRRFAGALASFFAVLCALNALVTGNLVQANAAVSLFGGNRMISGVVLSLLVALSAAFGTRRIEKLAARMMPPLTLFYIGAALFAILPRARLLPSLIGEIFSSAFSTRAVMGGAVGFTAREAMRYGVMRGIFSNEAGCGTSPTAHASADTDSEEKQAALGVVEVVFDTMILCTLTAFVLLTADAEGGILPWGETGDAAPAAMAAFGALAGEAVSFAVRISTALFAFASIVAQIYYGLTAVRFLSEKKGARGCFLALSVFTPILGAAVSPGLMWTAADLLLGLMTAVNCAVLLRLRGTLRP